MMRLDVRGATGEEQPVEPLDQLLEAQLPGELGNQHGRRARRIDHRARVLLPDHVKGMTADHAPVGGNTNERAGGCHDGLPAGV